MDRNRNMFQYLWVYRPLYWAVTAILWLAFGLLIVLLFGKIFAPKDADPVVVAYHFRALCTLGATTFVCLVAAVGCLFVTCKVYEHE